MHGRHSADIYKVNVVKSAGRLILRSESEMRQWRFRARSPSPLNRREGGSGFPNGVRRPRSGPGLAQAPQLVNEWTWTWSGPERASGSPELRQPLLPLIWTHTLRPSPARGPQFIWPTSPRVTAYTVFTAAGSSPGPGGPPETVEGTRWASQKSASVAEVLSPPWRVSPVHFGHCHRPADSRKTKLEATGRLGLGMTME